MVNDILTDARPINTRKALDGKRLEYEQYCDYIGGDDTLCHVLESDKVFDFMYYQSFREQKKPGGDRVAIKNGQYFDPVAYRQVMSIS